MSLIRTQPCFIPAPGHVLDQRTAKSDLRAAKSFSRFPELEQACQDGRVSREKVDVILAFGLRTTQREAALGEFYESSSTWPNE